MSTALRQSGDPTPPRTSWWSALVLLAGVIGIAAFMYVDQVRRQPPETQATPHWGHNTNTFDGRPRTSRLLTPQPDDEPLAGEPADIAPLSDLPGVVAERQTGFLRKQRNVIEVVSVWNAEGVDIGDLAAFYNGQAMTAGFSPLPGRTSSRTSMMRRFIRETAQGVEILSVRLSPVAELERMRDRWQQFNTHASEPYPSTPDSDSAANATNSSVAASDAANHPLGSSSPTADDDADESSTDDDSDAIRVIVWHRIPQAQ